MHKDWKFLHVSMIVRDMDKAIEQCEAMGVGPFPPFLGGPKGMKVIGKSYRGKESDYDMDLRIAKGDLGGLGFELIQPLKGPSVYHEFLDEKGEGYHHLAYGVPDFDAEVEAMEKAGFHVIQTGAMPQSRWAYVDAEIVPGMILELCEMPKK